MKQLTSAAGCLFLVLTLAPSAYGEEAVQTDCAMARTDCDKLVKCLRGLAKADVDDGVIKAVAGTLQASCVMDKDVVDKGTFRDCPQCPEMVVLPAGAFLMGSPASEGGGSDNEGPQHRVTIAKPFAVGKYEVTCAEWDACRRAGGCSHSPGDEGWGRGNRPVIHVSWHYAQEYARWLSGETGNRYRLLSESEWEYAARAGTTTPFHFGATIATYQANYNGNSTYGPGRKGVYRQRTVAVGSFPANSFGLHDMHGNVWEWVEDCWHDSYVRAPADGSAWTSACDDSARVVRGGSWLNLPTDLGSANRNRNPTGSRLSNVGFRVARTLTP